LVDSDPAVDKLWVEGPDKVVEEHGTDPEASG
jgi:hypothetical protein